MIKVNNRKFLAGVAVVREMVRTEIRRVCAAGGHIFIGEFRTRANPRIKPLTGAMTRSLTPIVVDVEVGSRLSVAFAGNKYARIHEEGGTIYPKSGQYLTIPVGEAKTQGDANRARAPQFDDTFFIRSKKGALLLVRNKTKSKKIKYRNQADVDRIIAGKRPISKASLEALKARPTFQPARRSDILNGVDKKFDVLFILVKSVHMPARLGFGAAWRKYWTSATGKVLLQKSQEKFAMLFRRGG